MASLYPHYQVECHLINPVFWGSGLKFCKRRRGVIEVGLYFVLYWPDSPGSHAESSLVETLWPASIYFSVIFDHNEYSFLHHDYSLWSYMRIMSTHFCIMTSHFGHFLGHNDHLIFPENCHDYSLSPNNQPSWLVIITQ